MYFGINFNRDKVFPRNWADTSFAGNEDESFSLSGMWKSNLDIIISFFFRDNKRYVAIANYLDGIQLSVNYIEVKFQSRYAGMMGVGYICAPYDGRRVLYDMN